MTAGVLRIAVDGKRAAESLKEEAARELNGAPGEVVLDFSGVARIDAAAVHALEELAVQAEERKVRLVLDGIRTDVYKVLKLLRLAERFGFAPPSGDGRPQG